LEKEDEQKRKKGKMLSILACSFFFCKEEVKKEGEEKRDIHSLRGIPSIKFYDSRLIVFTSD
jgi:hypothetical protein